MSLRAASLLSVILSLLLLVIFAVLMVFVELIALNGASEGQGMSAMAISLACLGVGGIVLGVLAWNSTSTMITKRHWNPALAVTLTVALGFLIAGMISLLAMFISIPLAGIR